MSVAEARARARATASELQATRGLARGWLGVAGRCWARGSVGRAGKAGRAILGE